MDFNGFFRFDFNEDLMGFWGLILVMGFSFLDEFMGFSLDGI